jgi:hypothetical protein
MGALATVNWLSSTLDRRAVAAKAREARLAMNGARRSFLGRREQPKLGPQRPRTVIGAWLRFHFQRAHARMLLLIRTQSSWTFADVDTDADGDYPATVDGPHPARPPLRALALSRLSRACSSPMQICLSSLACAWVSMACTTMYSNVSEGRVHYAS